MLFPPTLPVILEQGLYIVHLITENKSSFPIDLMTSVVCIDTHLVVWTRALKTHQQMELSMTASGIPTSICIELNSFWGRIVRK